MRFWHAFCFTTLLIGNVTTDSDIGLFEVYRKDRMPTHFRNRFQFTPQGQLFTTLNADASRSEFFDFMKDADKPLELAFSTQCLVTYINIRFVLTTGKNMVKYMLSLQCPADKHELVQRLHLLVYEGHSVRAIPHSLASCDVVVRFHERHVELISGNMSTTPENTSPNTIPFDTNFTRIKRERSNDDQTAGLPDANVVTLNIHEVQPGSSNTVCKTQMLLGKYHYLTLYSNETQRPPRFTTPQNVEPPEDALTTAMIVDRTSLATTEAPSAKSDMFDWNSSGTILWIMLFTLCGLTSLSIGSVCMFFILHCSAKQKKNKAKIEDEDVHTGIERDSAILPVIAPPFAPNPDPNPSKTVKNASVSRQTSLTNGVPAVS